MFFYQRAQALNISGYSGLMGIVDNDINWLILELIIFIK